ncbi:hypothetical protein GLOIN_2v1884965 [Rhizophagus clarus]|uniref:Uncharacterized protein n=1 Tax=Rhizophagus clarus TaxID=94130 RepID=A0A8H3MAB3_9GLOM|nr:hypothetical protein GLOIN_2v1884965 [Rhizophagus clarus]
MKIRIVKKIMENRHHLVYKPTDLKFSISDVSKPLNQHNHMHFFNDKLKIAKMLKVIFNRIVKMYSGMGMNLNLLTLYELHLFNELGLAISVPKEKYKCNNPFIYLKTLKQIGKEATSVILTANLWTNKKSYFLDLHKFTTDNNKLMLLVKMACIIESQLELTVLNDMIFIKTKSLIYSPFHTVICYILFEIGYSREARWLEYLSDKWGEFANFFIIGFLEAIYTNEEIALFKPITNTFAQRRSKLTLNKLSITKSIISKSNSNIIELVEDIYKEASNDSLNEDTTNVYSIMIDDNMPTNYKLKNVNYLTYVM